MDIWIWAGVIVFALVIEFITPELVSIWFAAGALVALVLAAVAVPLWVQATVFVVISFLLLIFLRRTLTKYLKSTGEGTNADSFIGKKYVLIKAIPQDGKGQVVINGVEWTAVSQNEQTFEKGEKVVVVEIKGNKLMVKGEKE